jgi:hypothetical protein
MSTLGIVSQPGRSRKDRFERISDRAGAPGRFNGRSRVTGLDKRVVAVHRSRVTTVQIRIEPQKSSSGASVDPTEARNAPVLVTA